MDLPSSQFINRLPPLIDSASEAKEMLDKTYYEAEHIPIKVYMRPLKCASDPRLRLNLTRLPVPIPTPAIKKSVSGIKSLFMQEKRAANRTIPLQVPEPIHARAASDIISALKTTSKTPKTVKTWEKSSLKHKSKASLCCFSTGSPISTKSMKSGTHIHIGVRKLVDGLSMVLSTGFPSSTKLLYVPAYLKGRTALRLR